MLPDACPDSCPNLALISALISPYSRAQSDGANVKPTSSEDEPPGSGPPIWDAQGNPASAPYDPTIKPPPDACQPRISAQGNYSPMSVKPLAQAMGLDSDRDDKIAFPMPYLRAARGPER